MLYACEGVHTEECLECGQGFSLDFSKYEAGNTKGGSITVPLTSCLTGLESAV